MVSAPRQFAARFLNDQNRPGDFAENRLERDNGFLALQPADRRLAQELILGVLRWQATLDWLVAQKTAGRAQKPKLQTLLRLGLYQLFWLDRVPDYAAVNDTVTLARQLGFGPQSGFVNALLRGYARNREATRQLIKDLRRTQPAIGWSFPDWLIKRWANSMETEELARFCQIQNTPPPTYARVNTLRFSTRDLIGIWIDEGVEFIECSMDWIEPGIVFELASHPPLRTLPSFQQGAFYIQDPSTLLAVRELDPQPGDVVLDLCAAPGGKTTYAAQRMRNTGKLLAHDATASRLPMLRENCSRLGLDCVTVLESLPEESPIMDRVLVDAPCSNTGVLRRRVESRWRLDPVELPSLAGTQLKLLDQANRRLKPGGRLVYSTRSMEPEENQEVIKRFLETHTGYTLEADRRLHPLREGVDGAYVARLRKLETCGS